MPLPPDACSTQRRLKTLSRVIYWSCSATLPDPLTDAAAKALFDNGVFVPGSVLANIVVNDPNFEDVLMSECAPADKIVATREITAEDRVMVSAASGSPATVDNYIDYDFYQDKTDKTGLVNFALAFCDGDVVIPKNANGQPLRGTMTSYISYQKPQTQGGQWIEFKKISIMFQGDPLAFFTATPAFNINTAGIVL